MRQYVKLWLAFAFVMIVSFAVLGYYGRKIYREAPPIPAQIVDSSGKALFGVYGNLGTGLMLFCLKGLAARHVWKDGVIRFAFWAIKIGLAAKVLISILPVGFLQTLASVEHGMRT